MTAGAAPRSDRPGGPAVEAALRGAAESAGLAPSILNTQPWRWRVRGTALQLYADPDRRLDAIDPHGHLLTLSCGIALHHARVALAAAGYEPAVHRLPEPDRPLLLARLDGCRPVPPSPGVMRLYRSIRRRRTDRRPFSAGVPVPPAGIEALRAAADGEHARLCRIEPADVVYLRYAVQGAHVIEAKDEGQLAQLRAWTSRDAHARDGVPPGTVPAPAPRPVPLRDFALGGAATLAPGSGDDRFAEYLVVATDGDEPADWLAAGEAVSAVWLTATARGLAASPMSDVIEIPGARALLRSLVHPPGQPHLVLRVGVDAGPVRPPASPRRPAGEIVDPP